jgi:uncharacterized membrane protein
MLVPIAIGGLRDDRRHRRRAPRRAPRLVDLLSISAAYTRKIALIHMAINLTVLALFVVNAFLRHGKAGDLQLPTLLSVVGLLLLLVSGWLGGKMVFEAGVGVRPGAG